MSKENDIKLSVTNSENVISFPEPEPHEFDFEKINTIDDRIGV